MFPTLSPRRIYAIFLQEYYVHVHSVELWFDVFVYSTISLMVFGFLSKYLITAGGGTTERSYAGEYLLTGMLLWEIVRITQYTVSVDPMWNIWSRNLSNMFISPLQMSEYIIALALSGIAQGLLVFILESVIAYFVFGINILSIDVVTLIIAISQLLMFAISIGIVIFGLICKFGIRIQTLAWGIVPMLQPLTAALFPVSTLPLFLQPFSYIFPTTYIFELTRLSISQGDAMLASSLAWHGFAVNIMWLIVCGCVFRALFRSSLATGQFSRNEG